MSDHAIELRSLSKAFSPARDVLRDVNLEVAPGEIVAVLGANGAGKTTLLEILSTLLLPTSGDARVHGRSVVAEPVAVRELIGYSPCGFDSFYPRLTATANLEFFAALNGFQLRTGRQRLGHIYDLLGINGSRHLDFQRHSTGMKQKLVLARALLVDPAVLLLDEPSKSLDPRAQQELWALLRSKLAGELKKTILLVTHSLAEAQEVCDRVVLLRNGTIREIDDPRSMTARQLGEIFHATQTGPKPCATPAGGTVLQRCPAKDETHV
jgi:ABC-2 type transport system ATP-binding protein